MKMPTTFTKQINIDWNGQFVLIDDWINYHDTNKHDRRWKIRCGNCLAPCCFFGMSGFPYDYRTEKPKLIEMQKFYNDFVIMWIKKYTWEETVNMGFKINLNPEECGKLQICPLNILGDCLIYEDRPSICRSWKCSMGTKKYLGVK